MNTTAAQQVDLLAPTLEPQPTHPIAARPAHAIEPAVTPADLLRIAMQSDDRNIERLERLAAMDERYREMQERERKRQAELAFRRDFAGFTGENISVPKTRHVDRGRAGSFEQAEYHVVSDMLKPALARHGFGFRHDQKFGARRFMTEGVESDVPWVWVTCFLEHRDGHVERLDLEGPPGDLSANTPTQNMQATASYLKRQSLLAITGTATGGEDDERKLRRPAAGQQEPEREPDEVEELADAGREAALGGMQALTKWWGSLSAKQRSLMTKDFAAMRRAAQTADKEAGRAQ